MVVKIMIVVTAIILGIIAGYLGLIAFLQKCFKKSRAEAESMVNEKIESLIKFFSSKPVTTMTCDVAIGANGVAFRDDIVNDSFKGFYDIWHDWYFVRCFFSDSGNTLVYNFRVYNPRDNISRKLTLQRARQVAEKALMEHFHEMGVYDREVDDFIAVNQKGDRLAVVIACNEAGFAEIRKLRDSVH